MVPRPGRATNGEVTAGDEPSADRRWTRALVTGASSGIGRAMASRLAASGTELVVVARDEARLRSLVDSIDVQAELMVCDLADRDALAAVERRIESPDRPIDLLVNNAGLGFGGPFAELDRDAATFVVDVNVVALQRLTQAGDERLRGVVGGGVGADRVAGERADVEDRAPTPFGETGRRRLGQSLAAELAGSGVTITTLLPGFTRTQFQQRSGTDVSDVPQFLWQSPEAVAAAGLDGAAAGMIEVVPSRRYRAFRAVNRVLPGAVKRRAAMNVARRSSE